MFLRSTTAPLAVFAAAVCLPGCLIDESGDGHGGPECDPEAPCEVTAPAECPTPPVTWADVEPVFQARCVSCHDGTGEEWPMLEYGHVAAWYDEIRTEILACDMPPPEECIDISGEERDRILTWIRCGTPPPVEGDT